ncbi:hypothetical protein [Trinickia symbiotica]|uniref:hypothetical protein n=1 Tax=Trinickia symbiotica TaxID=863227 RepID=UPI000370AC70|nr:hypothetical protein [Trinickia symbiotica]
MAKAWDTAVIKADSKHPEAGRAGVVQSVTGDTGKEVLTIRLDETADGKGAKVVNAAQEDCDIKNVL